MNQHSETTVLDDFIIVTDAQRSALQRRGVKDLYSLLECVVEAHGPAEDVGLPAEVVAVYKRHLINWIRDYGLGAYVDLLAANGAGRIRLFGQFPNQVVAAWSEAMEQSMYIAEAEWGGGGGERCGGGCCERSCGCEICEGCGGGVNDGSGGRL